MKQKILNALKTKFSNLGFSAKTFDTVADFLATGATEETDVDNLVSGVEGLLKTFQGEADQRVTSAVAKAKNENNGGGHNPNDPEGNKGANPNKGSDDDPIAKLTALVTGLATSVNGLIEKDKTTSLQQKFITAANDKGIKNDTLISKWMPKSEEEFENALTDLESFNKDFVVQKANEKTLGAPPAGGGGSGSQSVDTKKGEAVLDSWVKSSTPIGSQQK